MRRYRGILDCLGFFNDHCLYSNCFRYLNEYARFIPSFIDISDDKRHGVNVR